MKKWLPLVALLAVLGLLLSCNKEKPPKLDYTEKFQNGTYTAVGMPGDTVAGSPEGDKKYMNTVGPTGDKKPEDQKPEDKKPEDKKPEDQKQDDSSKAPDNPPATNP
jgi:hypothetical protein